MDGEIVTPHRSGELPALPRAEEGLRAAVHQDLDACWRRAAAMLATCSTTSTRRSAEDFLDWLRAGVGLELYEMAADSAASWSPKRWKVHQKRGTESGVERIVEIFAGWSAGPHDRGSRGVARDEGEFRRPTGADGTVGDRKPWSGQDRGEAARADGHGRDREAGRAGRDPQVMPGARPSSSSTCTSVESNMTSLTVLNVRRVESTELDFSLILDPSRVLEWRDPAASRGGREAGRWRRQSSR